jgi:hypothetical protein
MVRIVRKRTAVILGIGTALTLGLLWYVVAFGPHRYRYRITVNVETPAGLRTGSAVREFTWQPTAQSFTGNRFTSKERGEAAAVHLRDGQTVFALLDVNGFETILAGFGPASTLELEPLLDRVAATRAVHTYPARNVLRARSLDYPRFVRFRDTADPLTVEDVDPDNLEASFGSGVRLGQITVQITDDPVTASLLDSLPWLSTIPESRLDANYRGGSSPGLAQRLTHGDFRRAQ